MIDLHSHVLPGVDDGAATLADAVALARAIADAGTTVVAATPHVRDDFPTRASTIHSLVGELRAALREDGVPLVVVPGAEVAIDRIPRIPADEIHLLTIDARGRHLLVETPYLGWPANMAFALADLGAAGITPILAHPERNATVQQEPERLRPLVDGGCLVQVTAASLDGTLGRTAHRTARALVAAGLAHLVASDAHGVRGRGLDLSAACATLGDGALARWLTREVGEAVLAGEPAPPRPPSGRARGRRWWRRGS